MRLIDGAELAKTIEFFEEEPQSLKEPPLITQFRKDFMQFQKEKIASLKEELRIS